MAKLERNFLEMDVTEVVPHISYGDVRSDNEKCALCTLPNLMDCSVSSTFRGKKHFGVILVSGITSFTAFHTHVAFTFYVRSVRSPSLLIVQGVFA